MNKNLAAQQPSNSKKEVKKKLPETLLDAKGKLYLSKEIEAHINYLHKKVGEIEWSGVLLYNIKEGSIVSPESLVLEAKELYFMDIGTASFTEYDLEYDDIKNIHELYPESDPMKMREAPEKLLRKGMIHTHHSMDTFFSATDMGELHDNTPNNDLYLSLIVNFDGKYNARLCFLIETQGQFKVVGREETFEVTDKRRLCMIDLEVIKSSEEDVPQYHKDRYAEVKFMCTQPTTPVTKLQSSTSTPNITEFLAYEFVQRWLKAINVNSEVSFGAIVNKQNNIGKMLKEINDNYKKLTSAQQDLVLDRLFSFALEATKETKFSTTKLSTELILAFLEKGMEILEEEFVKKRKLGNQTFLKDLFDAYSVTREVETAIAYAYLEYEDEMIEETYGYGYNGYNYGIID